MPRVLAHSGLSSSCYPLHGSAGTFHMPSLCLSSDSFYGTCSHLMLLLQVTEAKRKTVIDTLAK